MFKYTHKNHEQINVVNVLSTFGKAFILTSENREAIIRHAKPVDLAWAFFNLQSAGILTPEIREAVIRQANPDHLAMVLIFLKQLMILTQDNFSQLVAPNHATLLEERTRQLIWNIIPTHFLTQANFQRLLTAAEHANPLEELQRVRDQILGDGQCAEFNQSQSTHTASVHQTVSASAIRLIGIYGNSLSANLESEIEEIRSYVNTLDDSPKHQAAKRCIERITAMNYVFTDSSSVSIRQLLSLAYIAIHDDTKRVGNLEDAKAIFIDGLYEIQRGYNLDESGQDSGGEDRPICQAGTFNKLMEKLNGIHSDVAIYFITTAGASLKLPKLAQKHAITYLQSLSSPETAQQYREIKNLIVRLKKDKNLEPIWDNIKEEVRIELWGEFHTAYSDNKNDSKFLALINNGQYVDFSNMDFQKIDNSLLASPGYQDHERFSFVLSELLNKQGLWANRHTNIQVPSGTHMRKSCDEVTSLEHPN